MAERLLVSYSPLSWLSWRVAWILEQVSQTKHVKAERQHGTHSHSNAVSCAVARACRGSNSRDITFVRARFHSLAAKKLRARDY